MPNQIGHYQILLCQQQSIKAYCRQQITPKILALIPLDGEIFMFPMEFTLMVIKLCTAAVQVIFLSAPKQVKLL